MYSSGVALDGTHKAFLFRITGLAGVATTYTCWPSWEQSTGTGYGTFSVSQNGTLADCGAKKRLDQWGDSLTQGAGTTGVYLQNSGGQGACGAVDLYEVACYFGLTPCGWGISGNTTNQLGQRFGWDVTGTTRTGTGILATIPAGASDTAILATGRNDQASNTAMSAQNITDYTNCVNALALKYGKVICRGVLPGTSFDPAAYNAGIASIVSGLANPNISYVSPNAWTGITFADGTHPTKAGYSVIAGYEKTAYAGLI
jgi:lysophospholipase L1-like esterase